MVDNPNHSISETRKERKEKRRGKLLHEQADTQTEPKRATRAIKTRSHSSPQANSHIKHEQTEREATSRAERKQEKKQTFGEWIAAKKLAFHKWNEARKQDKVAEQTQQAEATDSGNTKVYSKASLAEGEKAAQKTRRSQRHQAKDENEATTKRWDREEAAAALVGEKETKSMKRTATTSEKQKTKNKKRQQSNGQVQKEQTAQKDQAEEKALTKKEQKAAKKAEKKEKRKFLSWWMILLLLIVFAILALIAGAIVGYSLGDGDPLDALKVETWRKIYDLVNRP